MSGHTEFTSWINSEAGHVIYKGEVKKIKSTFFTSDGCHNSDIFMIQLKNKTVDLSEVDYDDLSERFNQYKNNKNEQKSKRTKRKPRKR